MIRVIWNFEPDKVKRKTLNGPIDKGGLNMIDFKMMDKALKASWLKCLYESADSKWSSVFLSAISRFDPRPTCTLILD